MDLKKLNQNYLENGAVLVKNFVTGKKLELVKLAIEFAKNNPSPFSSKLKNTNEIKNYKESSFFHDYWTYKRNDYIKKLLSDIEIIKKIETISGNKNVRFFHDHILIKNPSSIHTPWHHDRPYYFVDGPSNFSIWISVDDVDEENSLAFCSGSHKSKNIYVPVHFDNTSLLTDNPNLKILDEKALEKESSNGILIFKMSPGDAIFFHNRTLHRSMPSSNKKVRSALSLRMLGDNACLTNICCKNPQPPFDKFGMDLIEGGEPSKEWFPELPF